ncbi:MAG TPA: potassium transporter TrkG [Chlamydiales bacterium]|nr:potassium transporter TrkG [Chlamydiales bacterium]
MKHWHPAKVLVLGYLFYSIIGCLLLSLPFCHKQETTLLDDYFVAISAASTTGLAPIDIGSTYNLLGQIIIVILIQLGGIGYMTFSSCVLLFTTGTLSHYRKKIGSHVLPFPKNFSVKEFIYSIISFTLICEFIGAISLSIVFYMKGVDQFVWYGIFHGVSAFCTAGLSLFSDGFVSFQNDVWLNLIICFLAIFGGLGFIIALDCYKNWTGQEKSFSFTSKVILAVTACFLIFGTFIYFFLEPNPNGSTHSIFQRAMIGFFQIMSASTTVGYNTVDIGMLKTPVLMVLIFCSTFGSAPSGTGGGLKNTAFATLLALVKNTVQDKPITLWNHEIHLKRIKIATVAFIFYSFCIFLSMFLLSCSEKAGFLAIFFEAANALNNSGLSMGLTSNLTVVGKIFLSLLMLIGRAGVLTFGFAISSQREDTVYAKKAELIL